MNVRSRSWLYDVAVFNESEEYAVPGDVSTFRTIDDMCAGMEAWMVEGGGIGFSMNGLGQTIKIEMEGEEALGTVVDDAKPDLATLSVWLKHSAKGIQEARIAKSKKKPWLLWSPPVLGEAEAEGILPDTIEGLLAYIHM